MATTYKILGQLNPAASYGGTTALYTVPSGKQCVVSSLVICNQYTAANYRIAVRPASQGTTTDVKNWIVYGATVGASDTTVITPGITLAAGDTVWAYGSTGSVSFSIFGTEL